jgi:hypothetical protein
MNARSVKKYQARNSILITWLALIIAISACSPSLSPSSFEYQVRVQAKDTGAALPSAQVSIEVGSQAPLNDVTDVDGTARIFIDSSREGQPARLIVETPGYKKYIKNIDLRKDILPTVIQLESGQSLPNPILTNTPPLFSTLEPTDTPSLLDSPACLWIPYLNGMPTASLSDQNCLNDLKGSGVFGNEKQISFFVNGRSSGIYGVCQDISGKDNLEFIVTVRDVIASARFFVTVGPDPIPNKSAHVFRFQPQVVSKQPTEMYLKFIEYTPEGYDKELNKMQALSNWKYLDDWRFDFVFQFDGAKASASINQMLPPYVWSLNPPSRYLCFAYQAMPTATQAAELEVHVNFP